MVEVRSDVVEVRTFTSALPQGVPEPQMREAERKTFQVRPAFRAVRHSGNYVSVVFVFFGPIFTKRRSKSWAKSTKIR